MRSKQSIPALVKPLNVTPILEPQSGSSPLTQILDNSDGTFKPNRSVYPTLLKPYVHIYNPNTNQTTKATPSSIVVKNVDGTTVDTSAAACPIYLNNGVLRIAENIPASTGCKKYIVTLTYLNPSTNTNESVDTEFELKTQVSSVTALSLVPVSEGLASNPYAANICVINPLSNPLNAAANNWKRTVAVQLLDGSVPVETYIHAEDMETGEGNALYFWYRKYRNGRMELLQGGLPWTDAAPANTGLYSPVITVDMSKIEDVILVCKAGYVAYGDIADIEDEDGKVVPENLPQGWLTQEFHLKVQLPIIENINIFAASMNVIHPNEYNSTTAHLIRRCIVRAGNSIINDLTVTDPENVETRLEKFFNITWYAVRTTTVNNVLTRQETVIGYGEWLSITPHDLGITSAANIPDFEVQVEPRIGVWNVNGASYKRYKSDGSETVPVQRMGADDIANDLALYLVDSAAGTEAGTHIVGRLQRNNIFRLDDGRPSPVVVVSAAKKAEIEAESGDTYMGIPKACFVEDRGYDILYGWNKPVHTVELHTAGDKQICSFSDHAHTYEGVESREIVPTLISPGLPTVISGKFRFIPCLGKIGSGGNNGRGDKVTHYNRNDRTYVASGLSQITTDQNAMAKNSVTSGTIPFAPIMDWYLLNILNANELKFGRAQLVNESLFGGGISSDYTYDSSHEETRTGVKWRIGSGSWTYHNLNSTPNICTNNSGNKVNWNQWLSNEGPRCEVGEQHIVLSWAAENEISPNTWFTCPLTGGTYKYYNVDKFDGILPYTDSQSKSHTAVELSARLMRKDTLTINCFDTSGNAITVEAIVMLQMSLVNGIDLCSCDVLQYSGAGMEQILVVDAAHAGGNGAGNPRTLLLCRDQEHLVIDTAVLKTGTAKFNCENSEYYENLGTYALGSGYQQDLIRGTRFGKVVAGSLINVGGYKYNENFATTTEGARNRMACRGRGYGSHSASSPRYATAAHAVSYAAANNAGGFQWRIPQEA